MDTSVAARPAVATTLGLCFAIALLEGLDLQSVGVAAPRMAHEFGLSVSQMGLAFSAGTFGLLPGAMLGGWLADRIGRKQVLIASVCLFGLLSIATAQVSGFAMLVAVRALTGLGLGGAMPNLIALSSESVEPRSRSSAVAVMYCGIPFGGVIASLIGVLLAGDAEWRHIFYVGGVGPLLLAPVLIALLPESRAFLDVSASGAARRSGTRCSAARRHDARAVAQLLLHADRAVFPAELAAVADGREGPRAQSGRHRADLLQHRQRPRRARHRHVDGSAAPVARGRRHVCGNRAVARGAGDRAGAAVAVRGRVRGRDVRRRRPVGALCARRDLLPTAMRGTGVGSAVAVGRLGSVVGPLAAAQLLAMGRSASVVIGASIPVTLVAAIAALVLIRRPAAQD
jgi:AAHS family 3-hydroxyphenylpropionic acid transporter